MITVLLAATLMMPLPGEDSAGLPSSVQQDLLGRFGDEGIDANSDGILIPEEVHGFLLQGFEDVDPHGPGPIPTALMQRLLERFGDEGIDSDNDGALTRPEVIQFIMGQEHAQNRQVRQTANLITRLLALEASVAPLQAIELFPVADTNEDRAISQAEWDVFRGPTRLRALARVLKEAPHVDADADGSVSEVELVTFKSEYVAELRARIQPLHPEWDTNGDGTLSAQEAETETAAARAEHVAAKPEMDLNGDGGLSVEEALVYLAAEGRLTPNQPNDGGQRRWDRQHLRSNPE
jgi:hypothetical protein